MMRIKIGIAALLASVSSASALIGRPSPSIAKDSKSTLPNGSAPLPIRWYVSIYASRDIPMGKKIEKSDVYTKPVLESKIPGGSICVLKDAIGKRTVVFIKKGNLVVWNDIGMFRK